MTTDPITGWDTPTPRPSAPTPSAAGRAEGAFLTCATCGMQVSPGAAFAHAASHGDERRAAPAPQPAPAEAAGDRALRRMLWLRHGCEFQRLYGDDGEMQCAGCGIDFKREAPEEIEQALSRLHLAHTVREQGAARTPAAPASEAVAAGGEEWSGDGVRCGDEWEGRRCILRYGHSGAHLWERPAAAPASEAGGAGDGVTVQTTGGVAVAFRVRDGHLSLVQRDQFNGERPDVRWFGPDALRALADLLAPARPAPAPDDAAALVVDGRRYVRTALGWCEVEGDGMRYLVNDRIAGFLTALAAARAREGALYQIGFMCPGDGPLSERVASAIHALQDRASRTEAALDEANRRLLELKQGGFSFGGTLPVRPALDDSTEVG